MHMLKSKSKSTFKACLRFLWSLRHYKISHACVCSNATWRKLHTYFMLQSYTQLQRMLSLAISSRTGLLHKCSNVFLLLVDTSSFFTESGTLMCTWKIRTHLEADRCECIHLSNHYPLQALYSNCLVCVHQLTSLPQCWARLPLHEAEQ